MKESAALAGGRLEIESASGSGTRVRAVFPLRWLARSRRLATAKGV